MNKNIWILIIASIVVLIVIYIMLKNKNSTQGTKIIYVNGEPREVPDPNYVPPVLTSKTNPKLFKLQDQVFAGADLLTYKAEVFDSAQTGDLYRKDQEVGRFISLKPNGWLQVAALKSGTVQYIPPTKSVYIK